MQRVCDRRRLRGVPSAAVRALWVRDELQEQGKGVTKHGANTPRAQAASFGTTDRQHICTNTHGNTGMSQCKHAHASAPADITQLSADTPGCCKMGQGFDTTGGPQPSSTTQRGHAACARLFEVGGDLGLVLGGQRPDQVEGLLRLGSCSARRAAPAPPPCHMCSSADSARCGITTSGEGPNGGNLCTGQQGRSAPRSMPLHTGHACMQAKR